MYSKFNFTGKSASKVSLLIAFGLMANAASAGQGWYVDITNQGAVVAAYEKIDGFNCWYPGVFYNSFEIEISTTKQKYTEEKWSIFDGCGGGGQIIGLQFTNTNYPNGYLYVSLGNYVPPQGNMGSIMCSGELGHEAYMSWGWLNGSTTTPANPVISCSAINNATVSATINIP